MPILQPVCGRFDNLIARDAYRLPKSNFPPRYNIAPTDQIPIVRIDPREWRAGGSDGALGAYSILDEGKRRRYRTSMHASRLWTGCRCFENPSLNGVASYQQQVSMSGRSWRTASGPTASGARTWSHLRSRGSGSLPGWLERKFYQQR